MSTKNVFRDLAISTATKQSGMVDAVTEEAPIFAMLPMQAASNGIQNKYEELKEVEGAQVVDLDSAIPAVDANGEIKTTDLNQIAGKMEVGEDKLNVLGTTIGAYFDSKLPSILRVTGANLEQSILYNNIRPYAKANGKLQNAGGTNSGAMYSMLCVKWVPGETTGLYNPQGWGNGKIFDFAQINGGSLYPLMTDQTILGYGQRMKLHIGVQLANPRYVSGIANIDLAASGSTDTGYVALPTESQIDDMLLEARSNPANTFIYMHPKVKNALNVYKGAALQTNVFDTDYNRTFDLWNGHRIITSYNFLTTEATEVFA
jgi:hypothetical protein